jgi:ribonuclease R
MKERIFLAEELEQAEKLTLSVNWKKRKKVTGFTIDDIKSKDLDDALWIAIYPKSCQVFIHIADVTSVIPLDSALDKSALVRVETLYLPKTTDPMLPRKLSENLCSLLEGEKRATLTIKIVLDEQVNIKETEIYESQLTSLKKFSYEEADDALLEPDHPLYLQLQYLNIWAQKLQDKRAKNGSLGCRNTPLGYIDENGVLQPKMVYRSQQIIQEFMILANCGVAEYMKKNKIPALYRNHTTNQEAPEKDLILQELMELNQEDEIRKRLKSCLNPAEYYPINNGHFALALQRYCHFTSPIRRVADYLNHRLIKAFLNREEIPYSENDLIEFSQYINRYSRGLRDFKNDYYQGMQTQTYRRQINRKSWSKLSPQDFSKLLEYAAENKKMDNLKYEIENRLKTLTPLDLYHLIFSNEDREIQEMILSRLEEQISDATMTLTVLTQKKPYSISYIEQTINSKFACWAIVDDGNKKMTTFEGAIASSKKEAKHLASLNWLKAYMSQTLIPESQRQKIKNQVTEVSIKDETDTTNYIALLNEFSQKQYWNPPIYEYETYEFDEEQGFMCVAKLLRENEQEITTKGNGLNKKEAKQDAAKVMCLELKLIENLS